MAAARQLLVSPVDRAWPQGLPDAVLELAQNPTNDWLFSHKANSQRRGLSTTLLAIVPPLTPREPEGCISALLHNSVTHIPNLHHLTFSFVCIMSKHLMQKGLQRAFRIRHLSYFFYRPTLSPPQRVSHCPFSNNASDALTLCLLCAKKALPIQGFPPLQNKTISPTYPVITQHTRASVDMQGRLSYTQAHAKNQSNKERTAQGGL